MAKLGGPAPMPKMRPTPSRSRAVRAAAGLAGTAGVWLALAALRPDTTYHLAPALVAWSYPYLRLTGDRVPLLQAAGAVLVGAVSAAGLTGVLAALALLQGPVLFGADATGEALIIVGVATLIGLAVAAVRARSR